MKYDFDLLDQTSDAFKEILAQMAAGHSIVSRAKQIQHVKAIIEAIPETLKETFGSTTEAQILAYMEPYFKGFKKDDDKDKDKNTQVQDTAPKKKGSRKPQQDYVAPAGPAVNQGMQELAVQEFTARQRMSDLSGITKLLCRTPDLEEVLKGKKVVPFMTDKTLAAHEKNLVDTAENKKSFDDFKNARANSQLVDVAIADKNHRIDGVKIQIPTSETGTTAEKEETMSNPELLAFLIGRTTLRIGTVQSPIGVGAYIKKFVAVDNKGRASSSADGYGKPLMALVGKKLAIETSVNCMEVISEVDVATPVTKKKVSTNITFKIYDGDADPSTGLRKEKTVRVGGYLEDFPNYTVKEEYKDHFQNRQQNTVSTVLTSEEKESTQKMIANISQAIGSGKIVGVSSTSLGADFLAKIKSVSAGAADKDKATADASMAGAK